MFLFSGLETDNILRSVLNLHRVHTQLKVSFNIISALMPLIFLIYIFFIIIWLHNAPEKKRVEEQAESEKKHEWSNKPNSGNSSNNNSRGLGREC